MAVFLQSFKDHGGGLMKQETRTIVVTRSIIGQLTPSKPQSQPKAILQAANTEQEA